MTDFIATDLDRDLPPSSESPSSMPAPDAELFDAYSSAVMGAVARAGPGVVHIGVEGQQGRAGAGSGLIVASDGLVLTNSHVVQGAARITVTLGGGQRLPAQIIGLDPDTDIAVLRSDGP